jgi:hypothetical protein
VEAAPDHPSLGRVVELDEDGQVRSDASDSPAHPGDGTDGPADPTGRTTDRTNTQEPHDG